VLVANKLTRRINGRILFRDLSFTVDRGDTLVVHAPSGAGKTLLLRLLAWLDPPDDGGVTLEGRTPVEWGVPSWRAHVTYVAQRPPRVIGTAATWLAAVAELAVQRARSTSDAREHAATWGLPASIWEQPFAELSGGEQQRLALAVALSREPDVLLLDEPTSALDVDVARRVEASLRGRTLVWVTHDATQTGRVGGRVLELAP
jgi:ABC-type iron transport system FetAB ATPase subunit